MATRRSTTKPSARPVAKPRAKSKARAPAGGTTHIQIPGLDPRAAPPGDKPRPEIPQWRRHRYGIHGMFGVVTSSDMLYTMPYQPMSVHKGPKVLHTLSIGLKVARGAGVASISYAVPIPQTSPARKVYCRGVCVTIRQDFHPPRKSGQPAFEPMLGVRLWDGATTIGYEAWPPAKNYSKFLDQYIKSEWFFRKTPPAEPLAQSLTVELMADFTVDEGTPVHSLEVRLVEVDIAMFGSP
jgi:hypothetical protein